MSQKHINQLADYIAELNEEELQQLTDRLATAHPAAADRLSTFLGYCLFDEYVNHNPTLYEDPEYV
jgi:hypothetical protein